LHLRRWLTALVVLPLLLLVLLKGGRFFFVVLLLVVNALALWEFLGMFTPQAEGPRRFKTIILGSLVLLSFCTATPGSAICKPLGIILCNPSTVLLVLVWCLFFLFLFHLLSYGHIQELSRDLAINALGLLYLPFLLGHLVWLRYLFQGEWWILWLLCVIFVGDTAAFYVGQALGETKLYPVVSPGKTWVGAVGGVAACLGAGVLAGKWLLPGMRLSGLVWLSLTLALVGLLGDLFESMLKRQARVKDASHILPGHGGFLDRLDSLLFAAPVVVYARLFILGW
jgi:phosphatidate cytidylyltransferase